MAGAATAPSERCFGVTNIKNQIPVLLDENEHNYDAWRELLLMHCMSYEVSGHLDGTTQPLNANDDAWVKRDNIVKIWLYGTMAPPLFQNSFQAGGTARDLWVRVENLFRNNKEARAIQLDNELRTLEIGDLGVAAYCQKMKSTAALLSNVGTAVAERTLVMYILNGLNEKFDNIINVIQHKDPFPSYDSAKTMLEWEEKHLQKSTKPTASHTATASSSTALTASSSQPHSSSNRGRNGSNQRGNRRGGGGRGQNRGGRNNFNSNRNSWGSSPYWPPPPPPYWLQPYHGWASAPPRRSSVPQPQAHLVEYNPMHAYTSETVAAPDGADWFMDSGASSHLATNSGMLHSNLNRNTNESVIVGNGSSIPVTTIGSSSIRTSTKPLVLNNVLVTPDIVKNLISVRKFTKDNWCSVDFDPFGFTVKDLQTRKALLRCDSSGDLYSLPASFKKPPVVSSALLASSPDLWHKRLAIPSKSNEPYHFLDTTDDPSPLFRSILEAPFRQTPPPIIPPRATSRAPRPDPLFRAPSSIQTRSKSGISKPKQILSLIAKTRSPLPRSHIQALAYPNWHPAMTDEHGAMLKTKTWDLVPRPQNVNIVRSMWLFKHKFDANGVLSRHKARLVANGKSQEEGVDFTETFSPVVKPATIRTVLNVGVALEWPIHQLDVKNAFLQGDLEETIYMHQPPGFVDHSRPGYVCKLNKAIYGLKQAPRAWNSKFSSFLKLMGFVQSKADSSLFIFRKGRDCAYLLLYVDDILLTASSTSLLRRVIDKLRTAFPMTDLGKVHHFLGIKAEFNTKGLFLSQAVYAEDIIARAGMTDCKPLATPVDLKSKLSINEGKPLDNPTFYRQLAGITHDSLDHSRL
ncbi:unnamed protein product [Arabidopsis halleri]